MIPRALRLLYPSAPIVPASIVEQPAGSVPTSFADPANSEHARLSASTAELWFALVARLDP